MRHTNIPAAYLMLMKAGRVLLLRRANTGYNDGKYSLVAGHVDPGESFSQCIIREAQEEAGIKIQSHYLETVHVLHRNSEDNEERVDVFFNAIERQGQITNMEPDKCDDLSRFDIHALPENTIPYIRRVIMCVM